MITHNGITIELPVDAVFLIINEKQILNNFTNWLYGGLDTKVEQSIVEDYIKQKL